MPNSPQHQCFIYEGAPSNHLPEVARTLTEKLQANYRCLYLNSPPMAAGLRWHLASTGLDLDGHLKRGALIVTSDQSHLMEGKFDTERMIRRLHDTLKQAQSDGYVGLWAAGDMTWEFGSEANLDKLADYERRLDDFMQENPAMSGICLYHRDTLPAHAIETALLTHPKLYLNSNLSQLNSRYYQHLSRKT